VGEQAETWRVPAVASSVPELRRALLARIAGRGFDTDAVALAVTEAITNAVRHAYPESEGTVLVRLAQDSADQLLVAVTDEGVGSHRRAKRTNPGTGIGLALIRELSTSVHIDTSNTGTTITMHFAKPTPPTICPEPRLDRNPSA
jgi:anti-sigma regulatory factor (Ser/Thr protein kinase)